MILLLSLSSTATVLQDGQVLPLVVLLPLHFFWHECNCRFSDFTTKSSPRNFSFLSYFPGKTCQAPNPCASNPCANGGQCTASDSTYKCNCPPTFYGQTCKQDVNECAQTPSPCLNGGVCVNEVGSYHCRCPQQFTGQHCETPYMPCSPSPCQNGGTCVQKGDTIYDCSCLPGEIQACT